MLMRAARLLVVLPLTLVACSEQSRGRPPTPEEIPEALTISGGSMTRGIYNGVRTDSRDVSTFRITTHPVTVRRFKQCIAAQSCAPPDIATGACARRSTPTSLGATFDVDDDLPVTCASPTLAQQYCAWLGARLPSYEEWLFAARGREPQRHAWGNAPPDCAKHPLARSPKSGAGCAEPKSPDFAQLRVGLHKPGAGASGLQDVLLTPAELLGATTTSQFGACVSENGACVVTGVTPGAIDSVRRVPMTVSEPALSEGIPSFGFRCVWGEVTQ
jgi:formylglycine-generating enzyme required for sulfatase activity